MLQSRNGPYIIFPLPVDNQSYFTPFDIIFQPVFPISFIYSISQYTHVLYWCESMLFYGAQVIHGIHGGVSAYAKHEFLVQWHVIANCHPWKSSPKMFDILCHVLHDLWPQKALFLRNFFQQNIDKNVEIVCQCEYASPHNSWQLMGTAWAWQYRHIRLGCALTRYYMTNLTKIGSNFRDLS